MAITDFIADPAKVAAADQNDLVFGVLACLTPAISGFAKTTSKEEALKRYMRTYLSSLPKLELANELLWGGQTGSCSDSVLFHLKKASDGYDRYMAKRGVRS
jgi:hypothetical protein